MHYWGDEWFEKHGDDLGKGISFISHVCRTYGRINMWGKEKYGTFRDEHHGWWDGTLQQLIWPGHAYIRGPKWFYWNVDSAVIRAVSRYSGIRFVFRKYQHAVYNYAIQTACKRHPNIVDEIVSDLDCYEIVRPGFFGNIDGKEIHDRYWTTLDSET